MRNGFRLCSPLPTDLINFGQTANDFGQLTWINAQPDPWVSLLANDGVLTERRSLCLICILVLRLGQRSMV
jgi:hypothetical protein